MSHPSCISVNGDILLAGELAFVLQRKGGESMADNKGKGGSSSSRDNADRRAGTHQGPYVNNGKLPRSRNDNGQWRAKRSDAGKPRDK